MNNMKIGGAIAYLRKRAGYTQKDLADRIGISDKAVSKWERGIALPDVSYISKLAVLLDTDTDSLLAGNMLPHGREWAGLLILPKNDFGVNVSSRVYGKPMVYILLGYFILMGIREIWISCDDVEKDAIEKTVGNGNEFGLELKFCSDDAEEAKLQIEADRHHNFMVVFDRHFLYGVDQTKFFQRAMVYKDRITVLSLPRRKREDRLYYNSNRKLVPSDSDEKVWMAYSYGYLPILFSSKEKLIGCLRAEGDSLLLDTLIYSSKNLYTETLDRGYVDMPMNTEADLHEVSSFVKIVQEACGMELYCIEEIAWRRGLIGIERLRKVGENRKNEEYGKYLLGLYEENRIDSDDK